VSACDASGNEIEANASQVQLPIIELAAGGFSGPLDHATSPLKPLLAVPAAPTAQLEIWHGTSISNENTVVPSSNTEDLCLLHQMKTRWMKMAILQRIENYSADSLKMLVFD